jgi:hypothetical protein
MLFTSEYRSPELADDAAQAVIAAVDAVPGRRVTTRTDASSTQRVVLDIAHERFHYSSKLLTVNNALGQHVKRVTRCHKPSTIRKTLLKNVHSVKHQSVEDICKEDEPLSGGRRDVAALRIGISGQVWE